VQLLGTETVEMLFFALAHMLPQQHTHEIEAVRATARVIRVRVRFGRSMRESSGR
jgi:hypothetical protein